MLAAALQALEAAHFDTPDGLLDRYADAAATLAEQDVAAVPRGSSAEAVRFVVVGTVLLEPVLLALRRLAQENVSPAALRPTTRQEARCSSTTGHGRRDEIADALDDWITALSR